MKLTRRSLLQSGAAAMAVPAVGALGDFARPAAAQGAAEGAAANWRHATSLFGDVKYPADFKHFDYVNVKAPKGGAARLIAFGTFDNFNAVVGGVKGTIVGGIDQIYDTLLVQSLDEVSTEYGLLAEALSYPADYSWVTYRLRANAKWHDGVPVSVDDVLFSLEAFKKHHPFYSAYYRHVVKAEKTGERDVTFTFDAPGNRELPQITGQLTVLPKHWWEGADRSGKKRDVSQTTLEPPLGCGAYRIKDFTPGRTIAYERVPDYWGKDIPVNIGRDNFQELRFEYFRDSTVAIEAFKADQVDWRTENSAKNWATAYDFPAVKDKRVLLEEFPIRSSGGMQAFAFNLRRPKFQDWRVRRAFNFALNFEDMNKQLFFGQYSRIASYFEGMELASRGLPEGAELKILETVRGKVPETVFTTVYTNPVNDSPDAVRNNLREATRLLREAGYEVKNQRLTNTKTGEQLTVEVLIEREDWERLVLPYKSPLERLGIGLTVRRVDDAQYENRLRQWDFDMIVANWPQSLSPGNEQRGFWGSQAADQAGSRNYMGIKDPAIDTLIERVIFSTSRDDLVAATKALDRVLLHHHFLVPQWTYGKTRTARWDRYARPAELPKYGASAFPTVWWWDADKASKATRS
ncbi:MAG: extracellular solute-binding protein [Pseudomonadota bacterium]